MACIISKEWWEKYAPEGGKAHGAGFGFDWQISSCISRQIMVVLAAAIEPDNSARPLATMLTASYGYQRLLYRSASQAAPGGKPDSRRVPFGCLPGAEGYSGNGFPGWRGREPR